MRKIVCLILSMVLLSSIAFAAEYEVNVEGLSKSEKNELVEWLEEQGYDYDVEESDSYDYDEDTITVERLSSSKKTTLVNWLYNRDYEYITEYRNGYYYVIVEYTSNSERSTLINYLRNNGYSYDDDSYSSSSSNSYDRYGKAYLVANGYLWYADGDDIQRVDSVYSAEYVLFTEDGALCYINNSKYGMLIEDIEDPDDKERVATSVTSITKNSTGYATYFRKSSSSTTRIDTDSYLNNDNMTVYVVKGTTLYSLSSKNKLTSLKSLKSVSTSSSSYYDYKANIGFSEWGDLVLIASDGKVYFNEQIDKTSKIELLRDTNRNSVVAKYLTVQNGVVETVTLSNGRTVELIDEWP